MLNELQHYRQNSAAISRSGISYMISGVNVLWI